MAECLQKVRIYQPSKLYFASDGPKKDRINDEKTINSCWEIIDSLVDWDCQVFRSKSKINLGCRENVIRAINWFFEHEEKGSIIEDDCLVEPAFLTFCESLTPEFLVENSLFGVSGHTEFPFGSESLTFRKSIYPNLWGWFTTSHNWKVQLNFIECWKSIRFDFILGKIRNFSLKERLYWSYVFDLTFFKEIDTWDYDTCLYCFYNNLWMLEPNSNLVTNIGYDDSATHTIPKVNTNAELKGHKRTINPSQNFQFNSLSQVNYSKSRVLAMLFMFFLRTFKF